MVHTVNRSDKQMESAPEKATQKGYRDIWVQRV